MPYLWWAADGRECRIEVHLKSDDSPHLTLAQTDWLELQLDGLAAQVDRLLFHCRRAAIAEKKRQDSNY